MCDVLCSAWYLHTITRPDRAKRTCPLRSQSSHTNNNSDTLRPSEIRRIPGFGSVIDVKCHPPTSSSAVRPLRLPSRIVDRALSLQCSVVLPYRKNIGTKQGPHGSKIPPAGWGEWLAAFSLFAAVSRFGDLSVHPLAAPQRPDCEQSAIASLVCSLRSSSRSTRVRSGIH